MIREIRVIRAKKKLKTQRKTFLARISRMTRLLPIISPEIRHPISEAFRSAIGGWLFIHQSEARLMDKLTVLPCNP
jgi:hypothetical protein